MYGLLFVSTFLVLGLTSTFASLSDESLFEDESAYLLDFFIFESGFLSSFYLKLLIRITYCDYNKLYTDPH